MGPTVQRGLWNGCLLYTSIAVDAVDGIFVTTTEDDAAVEFYTLSTESGFEVTLPGSGGQQIFSLSLIHI